jgi:hypothetical protein
MNVFFAPYNISSISTSTIDALRKIGVDAEGISIVDDKVVSHSKYIKVINLKKPTGSFLNFIRFCFNFPFFLIFLSYKIYKADILYWIQELPFPKGYWKFLIKILNKKGVIEFVGSDIRNPDILSKINPFYKEAYHHGYEYAGYENEKKSIRNLKDFRDLGFTWIGCPEMFLYEHPSVVYNSKISVFQRYKIDEKNFIKDKNNRSIKIVHAPTAKIAKGSHIIEQVINEIKKEYDIEYIELYGIQREKALEIISHADIFVDQIICGSYGMACIEAMSMGIPTLCYVMPQVFENGLPEDCPIVNSNPINLKQNLIQLIEQKELRLEISQKSMNYVRDYHDADKIAAQLKRIFEDLANQ